MLDQCIITVPNGPLVKPEIFTDENFMIDGWLEFHSVAEANYRRRRKDGNQHSGSTNFDLVDSRILRFRTKRVGTKEPHRQVIDQIELNLAKIAHGHNAIPIRHPLEFCGLLILARHALGGVLEDRTKASTLIPGLVKACRTHWSKIEIGMHIKDPGQAVYELMSRMRSTSARKLEFFDNTVRLKGTNVIIKVYNKLAEMVTKKISTLTNLRPSTDEPITRLEVELWGKKTASFGFLPEEQRPLTRMEDGKAYLEGFTLDQLKGIHRYYFSELKGIYHVAKEPGGGDTAGMAAVLAAVHLRSGLQIEELASLYAKLGMRDRKKPRSENDEIEARKRAQREMRNMIERFVEESSILTSEEMFSDEAYRSQPIIGVAGKYGVGEIYIKHHGINSIWEFAHDRHADRQIKDVYMARGSKVFTPAVPKEWWC